ncbi:hypothetical protein SCHPADRAFT_896599 [Schizopora paradoxa]|uniref:Uncharacterized protein n=1 Tax=Schizopora paradoxa TaxID=27342 RepID=A0A0H2R6D4_9AGAM|nr:hypothetical protein SCHPADRAFT_896599 [Schizopora paradoxa]
MPRDHHAISHQIGDDARLVAVSNLNTDLDDVNRRSDLSLSGLRRRRRRINDNERWLLSIETLSPTRLQNPKNRRTPELEDAQRRTRENPTLRRCSTPGIKMLVYVRPERRADGAGRRKKFSWTNAWSDLIRGNVECFFCLCALTSGSGIRTRRQTPIQSYTPSRAKFESTSTPQPKNGSTFRSGSLDLEFSSSTDGCFRVSCKR